MDHSTFKSIVIVWGHVLALLEEGAHGGAEMILNEELPLLQDRGELQVMAHQLEVVAQ
jgi:hypothetical protein